MSRSGWQRTGPNVGRCGRVALPHPIDPAGIARKGGHARAQVSAHPQQAAEHRLAAGLHGGGPIALPMLAQGFFCGGTLIVGAGCVIAPARYLGEFGCRVGGAAALLVRGARAGSGCCQPQCCERLTLLRRPVVSGCEVVLCAHKPQVGPHRSENEDHLTARILGARWTLT